MSKKVVCCVISLITLVVSSAAYARILPSYYEVEATIKAALAYAESLLESEDGAPNGDYVMKGESILDRLNNGTYTSVEAATGGHIVFHGNYDDEFFVVFTSEELKNIGHISSGEVVYPYPVEGAEEHPFCLKTLGGDCLIIKVRPKEVPSKIIDTAEVVITSQK